jgi:hypothetical protein
MARHDEARGSRGATTGSAFAKQIGNQRSGSLTAPRRRWSIDTKSVIAAACPDQSRVKPLRVVLARDRGMAAAAFANP